LQTNQIEIKMKINHENENEEKKEESNNKSSNNVEFIEENNNSGVKGKEGKMDLSEIKSKNIKKNEFEIFDSKN